MESVSPAAEQPGVEAPTSTDSDETDLATSPPIESVSSADPPLGDSVETPQSLDPHVDGPADSEPIPQDLLPTSPIAEPLTSEAKIADTDTAAVPAEDDRGRMQELPPELAQFAPFLLQEDPNTAPTLKAPPTMDEVNIEAATADGPEPLEVQLPKTLNLKADLAIPLALASDGYPLSDLMLLVSQITGVPIQLDWVSLDMAGIDIDTLVPIKGRRSARQLLDDVATTLDAEVREEETLVVFTLTDAKFEETVTRIADLSDFGDSQASATSTLNHFLGGDTEAGELQIGPTREDKQLAVLAIESLRRMRGIEAKIPSQRLKRWAQANDHDLVQWPPYSGGNAGPQQDAPITIAGYLRRIARQPIDVRRQLARCQSQGISAGATRDSVFANRCRNNLGRNLIAVQPSGTTSRRGTLVGWQRVDLRSSARRGLDIAAGQFTRHVQPENCRRDDSKSG